MPSLMFGALNRAPVPADEAIVRSTTAVVEEDAPPAMQDDQPTMSEVETDPNPHLGMVNRQLASNWTEGKQFVPSWVPAVDRNADYNDLVNRQVGSSGTAAAREAAGTWGHGSLSYAVGIEPVGDLRDGGKMGNEYFSVGHKSPQADAAGNYMSVPPGQDHSIVGKVSATGKDQAREAAVSAMYNSWYARMVAS